MLFSDWITQYSMQAGQHARLRHVQGCTWNNGVETACMQYLSCMLHSPSARRRCCLQQCWVRTVKVAFTTSHACLNQQVSKYMWMQAPLHEIIVLIIDYVFDCNMLYKVMRTEKDAHSVKWTCLRLQGHVKGVSEATIIPHTLVGLINEDCSNMHLPMVCVSVCFGTRKKHLDPFGPHRLSIVSTHPVWCSSNCTNSCDQHSFMNHQCTCAHTKGLLAWLWCYILYIHI